MRFAGILAFEAESSPGQTPAQQADLVRLAAAQGRSPASISSERAVVLEAGEEALPVLTARIGRPDSARRGSHQPVRNLVRVSLLFLRQPKRKSISSPATAGVVFSAPESSLKLANLSFDTPTEA